jgi:hypothetical protein
MYLSSFPVLRIKDPVIGRIEKRIAAWTFLPEGDGPCSEFRLFAVEISVQAR